MDDKSQRDETSRNAGDETLRVALIGFF